jgi:hypothetical protein
MTLVAAAACNVVGLAWLALAMDVHWKQVRGPQAPARRTVLILRVLGALALAASLALCLAADHATLASLVWVMTLAGAGLIVAFTLAWQPRLLAPLVAWARRP